MRSPASRRCLIRCGSFSAARAGSARARACAAGIGFRAARLPAGALVKSVPGETRLITILLMKHSASLLIQDPDGAYLVIQRSNTCNNFQGYWEFPGGKIDAGESPATALQREVREETGIEAPRFDDAQGLDRKSVV